jgi:acyl carrier protein
VIETVREAIFAMLHEMNYDVAENDGSLALGPEGLDLESLAVAELAVRIEDEYGVKFGDEEEAGLAKLTVDEFVAAVAERAAQMPVHAGEAG